MNLGEEKWYPTERRRPCLSFIPIAMTWTNSYVILAAKLSELHQMLRSMLLINSCGNILQRYFRNLNLDQSKITSKVIQFYLL